MSTSQVAFYTNHVRREIRRLGRQKEQTKNPEVTKLPLTCCTSTPAHSRTNYSPVLRTVTIYVRTYGSRMLFAYVVHSSVCARCQSDRWAVRLVCPE